ncbi:MAG: hypothetical protein U9O98_05185 [Asgard group archaeon]|nr:hypothetical protein [Asgard group archaeon]
MIYIPPEKKKTGGSSKLGDIVYVILFFLFEGLFIFAVIPAVIFAMAVFPVATYLAITGADIIWPMYVIIGIIVFFQILAIQYFFRRYVLEPHNKTLGQWLRWKFSPKEIRKRRKEKEENTMKIQKWYQGMERVHARRDQLTEEQSYDLRTEWFGTTGNPEMAYYEEEEDSEFGMDVVFADSLESAKEEEDNEEEN